MTDLFRPHAYPGDTDTSRAAATAILPKSGTQRRTIYDFVISRGDHGATIPEIVTGARMLLQSVCARRRELEDMRLVFDSGKRRKGPTGHKAIVWIA